MNCQKNLFKQNFLWLGIGLAALFWVIESAIDAYIFHEGTFFQRLVYPDPNEIWMRLFIAIIMIGSGRFAQKSYTQEKEAHSDTEASKRLILKTSYDAFIQSDANGLILDWNRQAEVTFGWDKKEVVGKSLIETLIPLQHRGACMEGMAHFMATGESKVLNKRIELFALHRDGHQFPVEVCVWPIKAGETILFNAFLRDITERKKSEVNKRLAATVFENAAEAILVTDVNANILMVNPAFTRITGYASSEVIGKSPRAFKSGKHDKAFYKKMWDTLLSTGKWEGEIWDRRKSGEVFPKWLSISSVHDTLGNVIQYTGLFADITLRKAHEERLLFRANYDLLTGLANRELFSERLSQSIKKAIKKHRKTAVFFIDLDRFKQVNDAFGHMEGDEILKMAADRLDSCIRGNDTLARAGGDEFLIALPDIVDRQETVVVAERIIEKFSGPFCLDGRSAVLGTSIGIAIAPEDGNEFISLIKNADTAMYAAKSIGGNCFLFFDRLAGSQNNIDQPA